MEIMGIKEVQGVVDFLLEEAVNSDDKIRMGVSFSSISGYYRLRAELPLEEDDRNVVMNKLEAYPDVSIHLDMKELSDKYNRVITRDSFRHLTEWSYRYGSKGRPVEDMTPPDVGEERDEIDRLVYTLNDIIDESEDLTVNDVALALSLADVIVNKYGLEEIDDSIFESDEYNQVSAIIEKVDGFIDMKNDGRLNWDMMASTYQMINRNTQEDIMEDLGKRRVIRDLEDFEGDSIEEFLESREI
jgi:hypothetical protein